MVERLPSNRLCVNYFLTNRCVINTNKFSVAMSRDIVVHVTNENHSIFSLISFCMAIKMSPM